MAQYRSTLMTHRFRMEAVEHMMSHANQVLQNPPKGQKPATSVTAFHGITNSATRRSDRARDTMKMLVALARRCRKRKTAAHTIKLPKSVQMMSRARTHPVRARCAVNSSRLSPRTGPKLVVFFIALFLRWATCLNERILHPPTKRRRGQRVGSVLLHDDWAGWLFWTHSRFAEDHIHHQLVLPADSSGETQNWRTLVISGQAG